VRQASRRGFEASTFHVPKQPDGTGFQVDCDIQREREDSDGQKVGFSYLSLVKADGALNANARGNFVGRPEGRLQLLVAGQGRRRPERQRARQLRGALKRRRAGR
jgi:hypothetical protein